jgi:hypothetical protein
MGTNTVNIKCDLNVDDAIAWNNYYLENSAQWKKNWKLIRFVFMPVMAICFTAGVIYLFMSINKGLVLSTMIASAIGIIIGIGGFLYYLFYPDILRRRIRKTAKIAYSHKNNFIGNHKYTVSAEGIRDNDEAIVKWTAVEDIVQTDTHVFVLVHPQKAIIIPKRAFLDDAAINRFMQEAKTIFQTAQKTA